MGESDWLADRFEDQRGHLRAVAYRMLGSLSEADDAVQEAWLHASRADPSAVQNLGGWLTTIVARVCLDMLRARRARREDQLDVHVPDPVVTLADRLDPEQQVLLADAVGVALLVVLDTLAPAERLAFVLHDTFGVPFREIAQILGCTPAAARQLASRARRRVRRVAPPEPDRAAAKALVDAFLAAARDGDFGRLLSLLDPDVVLRADVGPARPGVVRMFHGGSAVAERAITFGRHADDNVRPALVNGAPGIISLAADGRLLTVLAFAVAGGRIVEIDILGDPVRLGRLDVAVLDA